jgi:hypothetical protein
VLKGVNMSEENKVVEEVKIEEPTADIVDNVQETIAESSEAKDSPVEQEVQDRLSKMKQNMDRMAKERDEALKSKAEIEQSQKQEKIKRLEDEGKLQEAAELKIADLTAKLSVYEAENTKLNRDTILLSHLSQLEFRNERSREMAYRDIIDQLQQTEEGQWVHKSGSSMKDFVDSYSKNEENSFLFKVKSNSGSGMGQPAAPSEITNKKSLAEMTQQEVLSLAAKGQLGNFSY